MNKKVIAIIVIAIAAVAGFMFLTEPAEKNDGTVSSHTSGSGSTGVVLTEYGDFQCPACAAYYPVLNQVKVKYGDRITFQFRHFPLESIHVNGRASSRAAEAAGLQGKFWEMHDKLFETQDAWSTTGDPVSIFEGFARELGLDVDKFSADYRSSTVNATINADLAAGKVLGVESTPTFVINGEKLDENPPASLEAFTAVIDEAIASATGQTEETENQDSDAATEPEETETE